MGTLQAELLDRHKQHDTYSLKSTVLQVSHHGSDGSSSLPFLRAVDPEWAVIPAGNAHGHPHPPVLNRLRDVMDDDDHILRTDEGPPDSDLVADDSFIFEVSLEGIQSIIRVKVE